VLAGEAQTLPLSALRRVGDVILVHDSRALRSAAAARGALPLVGADVVTESGEYLGKVRAAGVTHTDSASLSLSLQVRDFDFDPEDGELLRLRFDAFGFPQLPARPFPHPPRSPAHPLTLGPKRSRPASSPSTSCPQTSCSAAAPSG